MPARACASHAQRFHGQVAVADYPAGTAAATCRGTGLAPGE
jgi:hypothetical protein